MVIEKAPEVAPLIQVHAPSLPAPVWPGIYTNIRLWRCDKNIRVTEILYTPNPEELKFIGADDYDIVPRAEAELLMAAKRDALTRCQPTYLRMELTFGGERRCYDQVFMPHTLQSGAVDGLICTAIEVPSPEFDPQLNSYRRSELLAYAEPGDSLAESCPDTVIAGVVLDPSFHGLRGPRGNVALTPTEWLLLEQLLLSKNSVATRESLLLGVWGPGYDNSTGLLHELISRLRRRLTAAGASHPAIVTVHRVGYMLDLDESATDGRVEPPGRYIA